MLDGSRVGFFVPWLMSSSSSMYMSSVVGAVGVSKVGTATGGSVGDMLDGLRVGFFVPWLMSSSSSMYMSSFVGAVGASGVGTAAGGSVGDRLDGLRVGFVASASSVTGALVGTGAALGVASVGLGVTLVGVVEGGSPLGVPVSSSSNWLGPGVGSFTVTGEGALLGESSVGFLVGFPGVGHDGDPPQ